MKAVEIEVNEENKNINEDKVNKDHEKVIEKRSKKSKFDKT